MATRSVNQAENAFEGLSKNDFQKNICNANMTSLGMLVHCNTFCCKKYNLKHLQKGRLTTNCKLQGSNLGQSTACAICQLVT